MTHQFTITGMTCSDCEAKVKTDLANVENVTQVEVSKEQKQATIKYD